ncbi:bifunctional ornithine acetyltransferase/N-acetylglutamate synthase protein ArgJ [Methanobrevibacter ruminantium M1]|uniref:Glutamate N-acetyltransferase n=1 Tax=Methanobrevibacter ruminantium (strain ATCC 35063 / DSM 1093 / JCM 13430 / OCM 146 / M1) TaxID=634498 RepID=D3E2W3_METRM|nr:bifunctional ornithine acetyltransferase/N-acetylglutamate synthase [Methanobrevibacter ruminantium]ADC46874.1 bifunctional ornithine acetyltransferase/N-acetylglutamate synthase protein ArgJ [Methanobrevibacter ruminantium M1]
MCLVNGVRAAGSRQGKYGLAVIESKDSNASAVFTSNKVVAAPVIHTKEMIKGGKISLVVANSGNANCFTGEDGIVDCDKTIDFASGITGISRSEIATASTGVIGRKMPMDIILPLVEESISKLEHSNEASTDAAKSLMTTDTYHKQFAVETSIDGKKVTIGGVTKGVGMIAPNMGTMLCFLATDASISAEYINKALKTAVNKSFNMIVVDGDESTNDTAILMANGKSGVEVVNDGEINPDFQEALDFICISLAKMMARDGEGATKFIECKVNGAKDENDAILASKSVISSSLVKSAIFGGDPNWGRIVAAVGYSGCEMDQNMITVIISDDNGKEAILVDKGKILAFEGTPNLDLAEKIMQEKNINILVDLYQGDASATAWGCDLTYDYVKINAEYTT